MNIFALELTRIPRSSLKILMRLAKTLRRDTPKQSNQVIVEAAKELDGQIEFTHKAVIARILAANPDLSASEVEFDWAVDALWMLLSRGLEGEQVYGHRGLSKLSDERAKAVDLPALREHAESARRIHNVLFGSMNMVELVRARFIEQVESMSEVLGVIEDQQLEDDLEVLVGPRILPLLQVCQQQYEEMVDGRLSRERGAAINLAILRSDLRVYVQNYASAVHSLYRPSKPETGELVLESLRPILTLRELANQPGASSGEVLEEQLEGFVELDLPEQPLLDAEVEAEDVAEDIADSP